MWLFLILKSQRSATPSPYQDFKQLVFIELVISKTFYIFLTCSVKQTSSSRTFHGSLQNSQVNYHQQTTLYIQSLLWASWLSSSCFTIFLICVCMCVHGVCVYDFYVHMHAWCLGACICITCVHVCIWYVCMCMYVFMYMHVYVWSVYTCVCTCVGWYVYATVCK